LTLIFACQFYVLSLPANYDSLAFIDKQKSKSGTFEFQH